ncbi:hypothetical protein [Luteitalea sp.]|jgi:hypothetical protein|uniref:hypothetical protein n=1 Tax=Luteitalea sp. TaxID=2004800 RepID=UPI0037C6079A
MTRDYLRLAIVATWLVIATIVSLTLTPHSASGWLTWSVLGLVLPAVLWVVTTPAPLTMSEAIQRGRE